MLSLAPLPDADSEIVSPALDSVRAELDRVIASPAFETSERNRRFLRYIVEETLAGRADRIKGYSVAVAVFERDDDFDPGIDPIVRIEASRLRRALLHYYLTAGKHDPLRIEVPKGGYVPVFAAVPAAEPVPSLAMAGSKPNRSTGWMEDGGWQGDSRGSLGVEQAFVGIAASVPHLLSSPTIRLDVDLLVDAIAGVESTGRDLGPRDKARAVVALYKAMGGTGEGGRRCQSAGVE